MSKTTRTFNSKKMVQLLSSQNQAWIFYEIFPVEKLQFRKVQTSYKKVHIRTEYCSPTQNPKETNITSVNCEPANISTVTESQIFSPNRRRFIPASVSPMYERERAAPTPASTRSPTPLWEYDGEKKVRFLESELENCHHALQVERPVTSHIVKNSTRFNYIPEEVTLRESATALVIFFPKYSRNIEVQVSENELESRRPIILRPYLPRHYRLFVYPSVSGLTDKSWVSKLTTFIVRALLSQAGLAIVAVAWWLLGALLFSTIEKPLQSGHVKRMEIIREDLVIELATELRQVKPYDEIWKKKIEQYMLKLENAVLKAVKSGYTSSHVTWTVADSFLYAVSLTTFFRAWWVNYPIVSYESYFFDLLSGWHSYNILVTFQHSSNSARRFNLVLGMEKEKKTSRRH
ncbi:hypothetical protein Avbf_17958 [Armadillidium vulgare]|nr:hypothetical protein Avbf_17958 [Armadillidium vulgare]